MFANQSYLKINSENDVDLQNILNDYINNFCDGYFEVKVKHKNVQKFKLSFQTNNLPHLLGLHYIQKEKINAKKIVGRIAEGKITKNSIKRHHEYSKIKDRLINYNFLHKCFIDKDIKLCVIIPENSINPQKIDIAFIENNSNNAMFLGIRKNLKDKYYYPATMYILRKNSSYNFMAKSYITSIEKKYH
ncbi:TPA: hypothetical protein I1467_000392 [Staphylococcus pseudintermedius]|nr:hypothetical protein [Staphylococcus pseudintermedius]